MGRESASRSLWRRLFQRRPYSSLQDHGCRRSSPGRALLHAHHLFVEARQRTVRAIEQLHSPGGQSCHIAAGRYPEKKRSYASTLEDLLLNWPLNGWTVDDAPKNSRVLSRGTRMAAFTEMGASLIVTLNGLHFCVISSPIVINRAETSETARLPVDTEIVRYGATAHLSTLMWLAQARSRFPA